MTTTRALSLALLIAAVFTGRTLLGTAIANAAAATLVRLPPCDPASLACRTRAWPYPPAAWDGNRTQLQSLRSHLTTALRWLPGVRSLQFRLADADIALGDRPAAAAVLPPLRHFPPPVRSINIPATPARVLSQASYESYTIAAYQYTAAEYWPAAVDAFRLALAYGAADMTAADQHAYLSAVAQQHLNAAQATGHARDAYLAGKYLARTDQWTQAQHWLRRAQDATDWNQLTAEEQARTWTYLGQAREHAHEHTADLAAARDAYTTAIGLAPQLRDARIRLLALLTRAADTADAARQVAAADLAALGPQYRLGQSGPGLDPPEPASLDDGPVPSPIAGWTLVGYDLDPESLEMGGPLHLWLWWQPPDGTAATAPDSLVAGRYRIQPATVINQAPNPGFERDGAAPGQLPIGYVTKYNARGYSYDVSPWPSRPDEVALLLARTPNGQSQVLSLDGVGIKSPVLSVTPGALYLTAAWLAQTRQAAGHAILGRQCYAEQPHPNHIRYRPWLNRQPEYDLTTGDVTGAWVHAANLSRMPPDQTLCQLFSEDVSGAAQFDRLLFAQLTSSPPSHQPTN